MDYCCGNNVLNSGIAPVLLYTKWPNGATLNLPHNILHITFSVDIR